MEEIIDTIAELLEGEECVFLHRETFEILSFPDPDRNEVWEDDYRIDDVLYLVETEPEKYLEFKPLDTKASYRLMDDFVDTLLEVRLKRNLLEALNSKKPFRHFRQTVEQDGLTDEWFQYKRRRLKAVVLEALEAGLLRET